MQLNYVHTTVVTPRLYILSDAWSCGPSSRFVLTPHARLHRPTRVVPPSRALGFAFLHLHPPCLRRHRPYHRIEFAISIIGRIAKYAPLVVRVISGTLAHVVIWELPVPRRHSSGYDRRARAESTRFSTVYRVHSPTSAARLFPTPPLASPTRRSKARDGEFMDHGQHACGHSSLWRLLPADLHDFQALSLQVSVVPDARCDAFRSANYHRLGKPRADSAHPRTVSTRCWLSNFKFSEGASPLIQRPLESRWFLLVPPAYT
ncbi:hypothetical protein MSAN_00552800 [Mycena sanguinolenta]|uniref:Uncharacterized protein n=1 Tax=Mycena sanguinolenta TaxID=230812 RepID=A0A8H6Z9R5_9AGAR|nr:hypothetical protein MSAN_00552800 [Mycena sanguinolenta]